METFASSSDSEDDEPCDPGMLLRVLKYLTTKISVVKKVLCFILFDILMATNEIILLTTRLHVKVFFTFK